MLRILDNLPKRLMDISPEARLLFGIVAAAGAATLIAIIFLLNSSLTTIATKTDQANQVRATELVQASIEAMLSHMTAIAGDNANRDGAAEHVYGATVDNDWATRAWEPHPGDARPYDAAFVLDDSGRILWGRYRGLEMEGDSIAVLGTGFEGLMAIHRQSLDAGKRPSVAGLSRTSFGAAVVSVGLVPAPAGARDHRYLVLTRQFTPALVTGLGSIFRVDGLHMTAPVTDGRPYLTMIGADKRQVAQMTWTPHLSGAATADAAAPKIRQVTWLVAGLIVMFGGVAAYSLSKLARSEKDARSFALTDNLSGLPNRRALFEKLRKYAKGRRSAPKSVVFIDLDGFKDVNDIYGHNTGDKLIMIVAAALKQYLPRHAMLARMGGDEFAMLVGGTEGLLRCETFAEQALAFLTAPIRIGERTVQIGASIGIATGDLKEVPSQELIRRADMAMYHSKSTGKGRITHYDAELDRVRQRKQAIEKGIRDGLKRDEFDVVYQPIVDARTLAVTAVEALVRWPRRPEGPLPPDQFISIAESSGLIHEIGQFVLKKACGDLHHLPDVRLSVNISPAQFRDPDFETKVAAILTETGFPVNRLELEVTEGYLVENPERAIAAISNLKAFGVAFALDDFGTGYSSIGYLRRFAFDRIKIDRSLAGRVDTDAQAGALVAGTVSIATALDMAVTAEGVETEDQARLLRLAGCHSLQGYYFSRPKPLVEVLDLIAAEPKAAAVG